MWDLTTIQLINLNAIALERRGMRPRLAIDNKLLRETADGLTIAQRMGVLGDVIQILDEGMKGNQL